MAIALKPLEDQVLVVTGASSGIGLVTARTAARAGTRVLMVARSEDVLRELVAALQADGCRVEAKAADVGDAAGVEAAAAYAVEVFGRIDTWVNAAGVTIYAALADTPLDEHERLFRTNYFGTVNGCQAAMPHLARAGGALVTVASIVADMPAPLQGAYAASKHAVKAYVEALRMEARDAGLPVQISLVKPSGIDTPIAQHAANHIGGAAQIPLPVYDPQLVADAILHCATRPTRDVTVGGGGRAEVLFADHFPRLLDRLAPLVAKATFVDRSRDQPGPSNLQWGTGAGRERSGEYPHARRTSLYTTAALHPRASLLGLAGVALAGTVWFARRRGA